MFASNYSTTIDAMTRPKLSFLLVDDDDMIRAYLRQILRHEGHDVLGECGTLAEADELIRQKKPTVVFLDINLHGGNGLAGLEYLREQSPGSLFIMLSGESTPDNVRTAIARGARDFLTKPFTADHVLHALDRLYKQASKSA